MTTRMRTWLLVVRLFAVWVFASGITSAKAPVNVLDVANAVTELDVARAHDLLGQVEDGGRMLDYQRARLAIYVGDCDSAEAILRTLTDAPEAAGLGSLARSCARATAGSLVVEDTEAGVWMRLQDHGDAALVPELVRVAVAARKAMVRDLGIELPNPLRIDLVRDLFSLAAVSGLPLEAAETTGTVAVARWGRVTMLSPRASRFGYPWEDTLAHEITHLTLSRGSRDFAPLWLQEGIAKREEDRWRPERPFDNQRDATQVARNALIEGKSVGVDQIGPSIAMLPTPEAASISYAEVESFMDFWIESNGAAAFALLMADLKGLQSSETDEALLSVTGYPLRYWIARWQQHLLATPAQQAAPERAEADVAQSVRLGDLLMTQDHPTVAGEYFAEAVEGAPSKAAVRHRLAVTSLRTGAGADEVSKALGELPSLSGLHGGWLGVHGRMLELVQELEAAEASFGLAVAIDPYSEDAACEGHSRASTGAVPDSNLRWPTDPTRRKLCEEARALLSD